MMTLLAPLSIMLLVLLSFFVYVLFLACMFWMIVDAAKQDKFWWLVIIIGMPLVGAVMYYFLEKKRDYMKIEQKEEGK